MARTGMAVLIATSGGRTEMLAERSLPSVYLQKGVDAARVRLVVVDDNADPRELPRVASAIEEVRLRLGLEPRAFPTTLIRNARTRGHSGTGAWNTGLDHLRSAQDPPGWVAILDDDDEFLPHHLSACITATGAGVVGVFERLEWVRAHGVEGRPFVAADLTPEAFFIGNPGVQGSNLFVRLDTLLAIGGFDEALPNTTDRDLMIRLLRYTDATGQSVQALSSVGVRYYDHAGSRVNTNLDRKHDGLRVFYAKHAGDFSGEQLRASLVRARTLFGYDGVR